MVPTVLDAAATGRGVVPTAFDAARPAFRWLGNPHRGRWRRRRRSGGVRRRLDGGRAAVALLVARSSTAVRAAGDVESVPQDAVADVRERVARDSLEQLMNLLLHRVRQDAS